METTGSHVEHACSLGTPLMVVDERYKPLPKGVRRIPQLRTSDSHFGIARSGHSTSQFCRRLPHPSNVKAVYQRMGVSRRQKDKLPRAYDISIVGITSTSLVLDSGCEKLSLPLRMLVKKNLIAKWIVEGS